MPKPEIGGDYSGIDRIGEPGVALAVGLDDGCGMHAGSGFERVASDHRVIARDRDTGGFGNGLTVLTELGQIAVDPAEQFQID